MDTNQENLLTRTHTLNTQAFDNWNDPVVQYWLGYFAGDGTIYRRTPTTVSTSLYSKDHEHIDKYRAFLDSGHKIYIDKENGARLTISSSALALSLEKAGIIPNKNKHGIRVPEELKWSHHYWRGAIDSDGSLHKSDANKIVLSNSSRNWIERYIDFVRVITSTRANMYTHSDGSYFFTQSNKMARILAHALYNDSTFETRLDRKYAKAQELFNVN